jgi:predicted nuclease of predicted toxin-antitoxin system
MSQLLGYPPKVIFLKTGNISTKIMEELLRAKIDVIEFFISPNYEYGCIEIRYENTVGEGNV